MKANYSSFQTITRTTHSPWQILGLIDLEEIYKCFASDKCLFGFPSGWDLAFLQFQVVIQRNWFVHRQKASLIINWSCQRTGISMMFLNIGKQRWTMQCQDDNPNQFWLIPQWKTTIVGFFHVCTDRCTTSSKVYKTIQDWRPTGTAQMSQQVTIPLHWQYVAKQDTWQGLKQPLLNVGRQLNHICVYIQEMSAFAILPNQSSTAETHRISERP